MLAIVILAAFALSSANEMVCEPDICQRLDCIPVSAANCNDQGKEFREHSSACGCCPSCVHYLREGAACEGTNPKHQPSGVHPPLRHCEPGTVCKNNRCRHQGS